MKILVIIVSLFLGVNSAVANESPKSMVIAASVGLWTVGFFDSDANPEDIRIKSCESKELRRWGCSVSAEAGPGQSIAVLFCQQNTRENNVFGIASSVDEAYEKALQNAYDSGFKKGKVKCHHITTMAHPLGGN